MLLPDFNYIAQFQFVNPFASDYEYHPRRITRSPTAKSSKLFSVFLKYGVRNKEYSILFDDLVKVAGMILFYE